mmetsp:Transcript_29292/g.33986  ORF Transcript_29292/g.33986 Transcript_29292/m.33986 type:complete len:320 (+) Transcript_29292:52-1011(+)
MTIKIERGAILCVINGSNGNRFQHSSPPLSSRGPADDDDDDFYPSKPCPLSTSQQKVVSEDSPLHYPIGLMGLRGLDDTCSTSTSASTEPGLEDTDDDDSTVSSCSSSTIKWVKFSDPIVTEIRFRPRTEDKDIRSLFYSYEETQRFRQEYREERKLKASKDLDADGSVTSSCSCTSNMGDNNTSGTESCRDGSSISSNDIETGSSGTKLNHRISRVVVLHKNKMHTFFDEEDKKCSGQGGLSSSFSLLDTSQDKSKFSSSRSTNTHIDNDVGSNNNNNNQQFHRQQPLPSLSQHLAGTCSNEVFFDNDSFWSGQITWY